MKKAKKPTTVKKEVPLHDKNYKKTVAKARRVHEKKTLAQRTNDEENTHRKRKWQAEQLYELQDPALEEKKTKVVASRPMSMVLRDLRQSQDDRIVYTDILARSFYGECDDDDVLAREAYLAKRGRCNLWSWQEEIFRFIESRESDEAGIECRSLMLCIDMGLGKTIISLAYLLADNQRCCRQTGRRFNGCTLIVCQNALLVANWLDEVRQKWPNHSFQYHRLYSAKNRHISRLQIEGQCDFLIVTYSTIKAAYRHVKRDDITVEDEQPGDEEEEGSESEKAYIYDVLYNTKWKRIIADESHVFVNRSSLLYKAMIALNALIKWVVTGTPIQNSLSDICSSFNFIGVLLGSSLERLLEKKELGGTERYNQLIDKIRKTLAIVMIRRLKSDIPQCVDNALTVKPFFMPVVKTIKLIEFETRQERVLYYLYATYGSRSWRNILATETPETAMTKKSTTSSASVLQLMMQLCLGPRIVDTLVLPHGLLTMPSPEDGERLNLRETAFRETLFEANELAYPSQDQTLEYYASLLSKRTTFSYKSDTEILTLSSEYKVEYHDRLGSEATSDLSCLEKNSETLVWDPFAPSTEFDLEHSEADRERYKLFYNHLCATNQDDDDFRDKARECEDSQALAMIDHLMARTLRRSQSSSKNRHIICFIQQTVADDKVLIFSNSVRWLETMAEDLAVAGIASVLVSGKTHRDYTERIARYKNPRAGVKVLLLSFKLGNVGINIPEANIIIFADPWWNPNMLEQAENRVQRPGQTKIVQIVYFILNRTIDLYVLNRSFDKKYMTTSLMGASDETQHLANYAYNLYEYNVEQ